jgi:hypothetical protein
MAKKKAKREGKSASTVARDDRIRIALARGLSQREAANAAGVHLSTIVRRATDPDFMATVDEIRNEAVDGLLGGFIMEGKKIQAKLLEIIDTGTEKDRVALQGIKLWFDNLLKYQEQADLTGKIAELQELVKQRP